MANRFLRSFLLVVFVCVIVHYITNDKSKSTKKSKEETVEQFDDLEKVLLATTPEERKALSLKYSMNQIEKLVNEFSESLQELGDQELFQEWEQQKNMILKEQTEWRKKKVKPEKAEIPEIAPTIAPKVIDQSPSNTAPTDPVPTKQEPNHAVSTLTENS